jgi:hypothetical protein
MKRMLVAIMAVAISFSAPLFAGEEKKDKKDEKKGGHVLVYGEEQKDKKDKKKGGHLGEPKEEKKDEKGKFCGVIDALTGFKAGCYGGECLHPHPGRRTNRIG